MTRSPLDVGVVGNVDEGAIVDSRLIDGHVNVTIRLRGYDAREPLHEHGGSGLCGRVGRILGIALLGPCIAAVDDEGDHGDHHEEPDGHDDQDLAPLGIGGVDVGGHCCLQMMAGTGREGMSHDVRSSCCVVTPSNETLGTKGSMKSKLWRVRTSTKSPSAGVAVGVVASAS